MSTEEKVMLLERQVEVLFEELRDLRRELEWVRRDVADMRQNKSKFFRPPLEQDSEFYETLEDLAREMYEQL